MGDEMSKGVDFEGSNILFRGGAENINDIRAFRNKNCVVTCFELTEEEIKEICESKRIFVSQFFGGNLVPHYAATEESVRKMVADYGGVWQKK